MRLAAVFFGLCGIVLLANPIAFADPTVTPSPSPPSLKTNLPMSLEDQLKEQVLEAKKKLGTLEPWQEKIFTEEVLPHYRRFIVDFRRDRQTQDLVVNVDLESLKDFLRYHAPAAGTPSVFVHLVPEDFCVKCEGELADVKQKVTERLELRGLTPIFLTARISSDKVVDLAREKKMIGALVIEWGQAPYDPSDPSHVDERQFRVQSTLALGDLGKNAGQLDIMDTDSFANAAERLMTDAFTEVGSEMAGGSSGTSDQADHHSAITLEVSGIPNFKTYELLRSQLKSALKNTVEEKIVSRGKASFLIHVHAQNTDQIKAQLKGIVLSTGVKIEALSGGGGS